MPEITRHSRQEHSSTARTVDSPCSFPSTLGRLWLTLSTVLRMCPSNASRYRCLHQCFAYPMLYTLVCLASGGGPRLSSTRICHHRSWQVSSRVQALALQVLARGQGQRKGPRSAGCLPTAAHPPLTPGDGGRSEQPAGGSGGLPVSTPPAAPMPMSPWSPTSPLYLSCLACSI